MTPAEAQEQQTFRALLTALSYPGRTQRLPVRAAAAQATIGATLLDLESSFYCPEPMLVAQLQRTGASAAPPATARYHFYPSLAEHDLETVAVAAIGSYSFPDENATLILGCQLGAGQTLALRGPGIRGSTTLRLAGLPNALWTLRAEVMRYPLGWDIFLVSGAQVIGLPRTTTVEIS